MAEKSQQIKNKRQTKKISALSLKEKRKKKKEKKLAGDTFRNIKNTDPQN